MSALRPAAHSTSDKWTPFGSNVSCPSNGSPAPPPKAYKSVRFQPTPTASPPTVPSPTPQCLPGSPGVNPRSSLNNLQNPERPPLSTATVNPKSPHNFYNSGRPLFSDGIDANLSLNAEHGRSQFMVGVDPTSQHNSGISSRPEFSANVDLRSHPNVLSSGGSKLPADVNPQSSWNLNSAQTLESVAAGSMDTENSSRGGSGILILNRGAVGNRPNRFSDEAGSSDAVNNNVCARDPNSRNEMASGPLSNVKKAPAIWRPSSANSTGANFASPPNPLPPQPSVADVTTNTQTLQRIFSGNQSNSFSNTSGILSPPNNGMLFKSSSNFHQSPQNPNSEPNPKIPGTSREASAALAALRNAEFVIPAPSSHSAGGMGGSEPSMRRPPPVSPKPAVTHQRNLANPVTNKDGDEKLLTEEWWNAFLQDAEKPVSVEIEKVASLISSPQRALGNGSVSDPSNTAAVLRIQKSLDQQANRDALDSSRSAEQPRPFQALQLNGARQEQREVEGGGSTEGGGLLEEWRSGLYNEGQNGLNGWRRSVDLYDQLNQAYQHSNDTDNGADSKRNSETSKSKELRSNSARLPQSPKHEQARDLNQREPIKKDLPRNPPIRIEPSRKQEPAKLKPITKEPVRNAAIEHEPIKANTYRIPEPIKLGSGSSGSQSKSYDKVEIDDGKGGKRTVYKGVGPTDEVTGILMATGNSIEEKSRKDWYRRMYASIHKPEKPEEANNYKPTYKFPDSNEQQDEYEQSENLLLFNDASSETSHASNENENSDLYPPHAGYRKHQYKFEPMRIEDYKPGRHSSIAMQRGKIVPGSSHGNRPYAESDTEANYGSGHAGYDDQALSPTRSDMGDVTRRQKMSPARGGKYATMNGRASRQRWDEDNRRRRLEIHVMIAILDMPRNDNDLPRVWDTEKDRQRLNDNGRIDWPMQKSSVLLNRFNDDPSDALRRPDHRGQTRVRGKAKALYTFRAQNDNELSFKRGDSLYLLKQIDTNWFKGEMSGAQGIFPVNYVQVILSVDDARATAMEKEGRGYANYDFNAASRSELTLRKGEAVTLIRRVDDDWYEGRIGKRQGIFPAVYVDCEKEPETPLPTPMSSSAPSPVPGAHGLMSPTSSACSLAGPDVPSAPMSPWGTDIYDSEFESVTNRGARTPVHFDAFGRSMSESGQGRATSTKPNQLLVSVKRKPTQQQSPRLYPSSAPATPVLVHDTKQDKGLERDRTDLYAVTRGRKAESDLDEFLKSLSLDNAGGSEIGAPAALWEFESKAATLPNTKTARNKLDDSNFDEFLKSFESPAVSVEAKSVEAGAYAKNSAMPRDIKTAQKPPILASRSKSIDKIENKKTDRQRGLSGSLPPEPRARAPTDAEKTTKEGKNNAATKSILPQEKCVTTTPAETDSNCVSLTPTLCRGRSVTPVRDQFTLNIRGSSPVQKNLSKPTRPAGYQRYRAMYAYKPVNPDELELKVGDVISVMERCDDGWFVGFAEKTNRFGTFPGNYVKQIL